MSTYQRELHDVVDQYVPQFVSTDKKMSIPSQDVADELEADLRSLCAKWDLKYKKVRDDFNLIGHYVFSKLTEAA